ncbi:tripartite tricarboxylate transporter TctB family protein [Arthrobacter sp. VKM Ac-2550]|uniref:tripartite tricarboxylate transporter TctB family protein n=1 Tax=Crystallibacter permensis TaxID=1938888 RepID=UPI002226F05D|nr:tripartite tricarboxylate transporter TctB family protein [Arthrobacter sp. VKM Ac-2550]MCW2134767.1 Tripartite tricarboxylate transporter TctB family protein [Arthrobacter sp. VKM Ac-2550]
MNTSDRGPTQPAHLPAAAGHPDAAMDPDLDHASAHLHPQIEPLVTDRPYRLRELVPVALCVTVGLSVLLLAQNIDSGVAAELGPTFWPEMVAYGLIGFGLLLVFVNVLRGVRPSDIPDPLSGWGIGRLAGTAVILVGYLLLWNVLQFWLITFVAVAALAALYGARGWKPLLAFPAVVAAILHFLFVVALRVPL